MNRPFAVGCFVVVLAALAGCGGPPPVRNVTYSASGLTSDAMARYDTNKDGKLDANELKQCPALAFSLAEIDTNKDKMIDSDELLARMETYASGRTSLRDGVNVRIVRGGRGVPDVTVTLEPESIMANLVKSAKGVTKADGNIEFTTEGQPYPGVEPGFFKIIASKTDGSGKETLPAKFNSATVHGVEVSPSNRIYLVIDLDK